MPALYVIEWEESEAGWGTRPDGLSLHVDEAASVSYIQAHWARQPAGPTPAEYDRPVRGSGQFVEAPQALYDEVVAKSGLRTYQHRVVISPTGARRLVHKDGYDGETFMALVASGRAKLQEVDDYVAKWHDGAGAGAALHAYLGLSEREYAQFVESPQALTDIALTRALSSLVPAAFTHVKTQGAYLALGEARMEHDGSPAMVYLGVDGVLWVREAGEFKDGRFAPNEALAGVRLAPVK